MLGILKPMKKMFVSVKVRLILITVTFSFFTTVILASVSFLFLQRYVRQNLIQATEFNLHFIAGTCAQDATLINALVTWCSYNQLVSSWCADDQDGNKMLMEVYDRIKEEFQNNHANQYIRRMIVCNKAATRIIQVGSKVTDSKPVTPFSLAEFKKNHISVSSTWTGLIDDPLDFQETQNAIPVIQTVYKTTSAAVTGYVYLFIDSTFVTDRFRNYSFSNDAPLYVQIGSSVFQIISSESAVHLQLAHIIPEKTKNTVSISAGSSPVVFQQDMSALLQKQQFQIIPYLILLIIFGTALLASILILLLDKVITLPLSKINAQLKKVAKGDFLPNTEIEWNNEIGDVGRGINSLAQNVQNLMEHKVAEEKNKRLLEYRMLQNQVNPHFLYNTLNSIKWMATIQNATGIAEMITSLARLLKNVSKASGTLTTLSRELELLDDYFVIQQYRYGGSVTFEKDIPDTLMTTQIPCFTLQPLLENAIFHGIEPTGLAGKITLTGTEEESCIKLVLTDNGKGMTEDMIRRIFSDTTATATGMFKNIGLLNVHKRIQYEFGSRYGLSIVSEPEKYTSITIELPKPNRENGGAQL